MNQETRNGLTVAYTKPLLMICLTAGISFCLPAVAQDSAPLPPQPAQLIPFSVPDDKMVRTVPLQNDAGVLLTLQASLDQSLAQSPRMSGVRALMGVSKAAYLQALSFPNPGIYLNDTKHTSYLTGVTIPVEPPWKVVFRCLIAKRQIDESQLNILKSMWQFRGEVRRNYAQFVMSEQVLAARRQLRDLAEKIWHASQSQFEHGNAPGLDVRRAKLAFIQAKMDFQQAEIRQDQAREQMNIVMGRAIDSPIKTPPLPDPGKLPENSELLPDFKKALPSRDQFVQMAKNNRLDLRITKASIATNKANLLNTYGNILPTPRFVVGRAHELNPPNGPADWVPFFQGYIDMPLFDFQQGNIARFNAIEKQLELNLKGQANQIEGEVELAYKNLIAARERLRAFQNEALPEADAIADVSRHGYELGQTDLNTLLDSQRVNIQIKSQYLDAVLAYQLAINDLEQAIGIPLEH